MSANAERRFSVGPGGGEVSAILRLPERARWLLVFAHGAGAGMRHPFMEAAAAALAERDIATFRYQFPYMEKGSRRPDPQPLLLETVHAAVEAARVDAGDLPLLAGGKSMGGRMTSLASSEHTLPGVRGLVFFGFPLHPPGTRSVARSEHLERVGIPMLFLQGTRDTFADLDLLRPVLARVGANASLHIVDDGDHSFAVPKRSGRTSADVQNELADAVRAWAEPLF